MIILNKPNIWGFIWDLSETLHIGLGKHAPYVFHKMMGIEESQIKKVDE